MTIDQDLERHIEEAKRPPAKKEPQRFDGSVIAPTSGLVTPDVAPDVLDASLTLAEMRRRRSREKLAEKLDRLVPLGTREVTEAKLLSGDPGDDQAYEVSGPVFEVVTNCSRCNAELRLLSEEEPGLHARGVAAGVVRRLPRGVICEECESIIDHEAAKRENAEKLRERVAASGLDPAMQEFEFSQMLHEEGREVTIAAARDWASEEHPDPRGFFVYGDKGAGKTRLAATAVWQRLRSGHYVTWVSWPILLAQLGAAFNDSARAQAISVLTGKGALVLDDIAQEEGEKVSDWARRQLFAAVDRRIQAGAPLLITANLGPKAIGEVLGEKLMSRVVGYSRVLELPGQDMRLEFNFDGSKEKGQA